MRDDGKQYEPWAAWLDEGAATLNTSNLPRTQFPSALGTQVVSYFRQFCTVDLISERGFEGGNWLIWLKI
jgi:hypothetical protein